MSVRLKYKITITAEPYGLFSSGNIATGPVLVLSYFLRRWNNPVTPPLPKNTPVQEFKRY